MLIEKIKVLGRTRRTDASDREEGQDYGPRAGIRVLGCFFLFNFSLMFAMKLKGTILFLRQF